MRHLFIFTILFSFSFSFGSIKKTKYIKEGFFSGGKPNYFSELKNIRYKVYPKRGVERWILDIGAVKKEPFVGDIPEYHVSLSPQQKQIKLVFKLNMVNSNEEVLKSMLLKSKWVKRVQVFKDLLGQKLFIFVKMKKPVRIRMQQLPRKKFVRRLALDLKKMR